MEESVVDLVNEDYSFRQFSNGIAILDYIGEAKNVSIPDYINDKPVLYIYKEAFCEKGIEAVTLPSLLEYIGEDAFYDNEIKEVIIPSKVNKIGGGAFGRNIIEKLVIESNIEFLPMFCFVGNALTSLNLPKSVKNISNDCFAENNFEELTIPDHLTEIPKASFGINKMLKKVMLPAKFENYIGSIFYKCDIDNITFEIY